MSTNEFKPIKIETGNTIYIMNNPSEYIGRMEKPEDIQVLMDSKHPHEGFGAYLAASIPESSANGIQYNGDVRAAREIDTDKYLQILGNLAANHDTNVTLGGRGNLADMSFGNAESSLNYFHQINSYQMYDHFVRFKSQSAYLPYSWGRDNVPKLGHDDTAPQYEVEQFKANMTMYLLALNSLSIAITNEPYKAVVYFNIDEYPTIRLNADSTFHGNPNVELPSPDSDEMYEDEVEVISEEIDIQSSVELDEAVGSENSPKITFDMLVGNEALVNDLKFVARFFKHPDVAKKWGAKQPHGILLHGPPGTGKTSYAHALANELEAEVKEISASDIYGMWMGESEANMSKLFDELEKLEEPTVVLFDEFEGIVSNPNENHGQVYRNTANMFKVRMAKLSNNENAIVFATTNNVDKIDPALIRAGRFDIKHAVGLPSAEAKSAMFSKQLFSLAFENELPVDIAHIDLDLLATEAVDFSGADIKRVIEELTRRKMNEEIDLIENGADEEVIVTQNDLMAIIREMRQS